MLFEMAQTVPRIDPSMIFRAVLPVLFLAAAIALPTAGCSQNANDPAFGAKVRAYLIAHPEVIEEALTKLEANKQAKAAQEASVGILRNKQQLERDSRDFVANPNGKITVVEFFDYKCPYCKTSADSVVKLIHDNPDVRFVFKEFPILSDTSNHAAIYQLEAKGQGHYLDVFQTFMHQPGLSDENVAAILKDKGVDIAAADPPAARAAVDQHLAANRALAHDVGVEGTPAFIVNGKRIDGWVPEDLEAGIAAERRGGGAAGQN
jgi:protein-disulfide isomerase